MPQPFQIQSINHLALTVTDVPRSVEFYTRVLGFRSLIEFGPRVIIVAGTTMIALTPPSDDTQAIPADQFNENRLGLDHLSFEVADREELEDAITWFDRNKVPHGEIKDLGHGFRMYVLAFRDPDNIQLEFTAPYK